MGNKAGQPRKAKAPKPVKVRKQRTQEETLLFQLIWNSAFGGYALLSGTHFLGEGKWGWALFQFVFLLFFAAMVWVNAKRFTREEYGPRRRHELDFQIRLLDEEIAKLNQTGKYKATREPMPWEDIV